MINDIETLAGILKREVERLKQEDKGFPFECCSSTADELLFRHKFPVVYGKYCGLFDDRYYRATRREKRLNSVIHEFSYDPKTRLFIDITASQFHQQLNPEILLMAQNNPRIAMSYEAIIDTTTHLVLISPF